jgi:hypothetical protein
MKALLEKALTDESSRSTAELEAFVAEGGDEFTPWG